MRWGVPRQRQLLAAWVAAAAFAGLTVVATEHTPPTAGDVLDDVVAAVQDARSAEFEGTIAMTDHEPGDDPRVGPSTTNRMRARGEMVLPDRMHSVLETGFWAVEVVQLGSEMYSREADTANNLDDEKWAAIGDDALGGIVDFRTEAPSLLDPSSLPLLVILEAARDPEVVRSVNGTELRFALDGEQLLGATLGGDLDSTRGAVALTDDGLPSRFRLRAAGNRMVVTVELHYTDWGSGPEIAAPDDEDVDPTPGVDEGALAGMHNDGSPPHVFQLGAVPPGWALVAAGADSELDTESGCQEAWLEYGSGDYEEYLFITMVRVGCGDEEFEPGVEDFGTDGSFGYVEIHGTAVLLDGSMSGEEMERLIDVLEPFDRDTITRPRPLAAAGDV